MKLTSGRIQGAQRIVIMGVEGIGKSTLASQFPSPIFIDTEKGTNWMNIKRMECHSWQDILDSVKYLKTEKHDFKTLVIDTADWAERFCVQFICANASKTSIESFNYGKGYTYLAEEFGKLLASLNALIDSGMHVVFVAHSTIKKIELPDQEGSFDHFEMKLTRQTSPLLKEWSDCLLFINYHVTVTQDDNKRTKAVGGRKRIIHTQHTAAYDAKNRWGLPDQIPFELPFDFGVFAKVLGENVSKPVVEKAPPPPARPSVDEMLRMGQAVKTPPVTSHAHLPNQLTPRTNPVDGMTPPAKTNIEDVPPAGESLITKIEDIPPKLLELMKDDLIKAVELKTYCEGKNFIPKDGKLTDINEKILKQMIAPTNWQKVVNAVKTKRSNNE